MVFKPVRTDNCSLVLTAQGLSNFEYCVMPKVDEIESALSKVSFHSMAIDGLDKNGWKLVDEKTHRNLRRIESQLVCIKEFIRAGIATLREAAYLVEHDNIDDAKRYIIFPYVKTETGYTLILGLQQMFFQKAYQSFWRDCSFGF